MIFREEKKEFSSNPNTAPEAPGGKEPPEEPEETEVIGIRFRTGGKNYYFDPRGVVYPEGAHAVVETARGLEYGEVSISNRFVKTKELFAPLRPALRLATPEDDAKFEDNRVKEKEVLAACIARFEQHDPPMKLIDTEYTFDNSKLTFYFTADGRVDFRELVRELASSFHCRIDLRQMGIRDEAKALGGLGICGRPFCCHAFLPDFVQVSIKMAKEQSLSLNAAKISGACGRLMCCLRYEYDTYLEEGKRTPAVGSIVHTRDGDGVVVEAKPLTGMVKIRSLDDPGASPQVYSREDVFPGRSEQGSGSQEKGKSAFTESHAASPASPASPATPAKSPAGAASAPNGKKSEEKKKTPAAQGKERARGRAVSRKLSRGAGRQEEEGVSGNDLTNAAAPVPLDLDEGQSAEKTARRKNRRQNRKGGRSPEEASREGNTPGAGAARGGEKQDKADRAERSGRKPGKKPGESGREASEKEGGKGYTVISRGGPAGAADAGKEKEKSSRHGHRIHGRAPRRRPGKESEGGGED